mgnify:CR=1 FL=1
MNKYKVQITQSQNYIIDVLADTPEQAEELASKKWEEVCASGTYHYHEDGDPQTEVTNIYDVTDTDDAIE